MKDKENSRIRDGMKLSILLGQIKSSMRLGDEMAKGWKCKQFYSLNEESIQKRGREFSSVRN
jgi:hypothetical protein